MAAAVQAGTGLAVDQAARAQPCLQQGGAVVQVARTAGERPAALGRHGGRGAVLVSLGQMYGRLQILGFPELDADADVLQKAPTNKLAFWVGSSRGLWHSSALKCSW